MINREDVNSILTVLWVLGLASWGGTVSYFYRISKHNIPFSLFKLSIEIITAGFVGLITYLLCDASHLGAETTAALVGISGHMGTRALFILEKKYENIIGGRDA